ncbi:MAG: hypothetical protein PVI38_19755, partial [Desulfobacterales bacterium]
MLMAMLFAGLAEGLGLSAMLPLISVAVGKPADSSAADSPAAERIVREGLDTLGIPPTLEALMLVIF